jgi:hypothetical protein
VLAEPVKFRKTWYKKDTPKPPLWGLFYSINSMLTDLKELVDTVTSKLDAVENFRRLAETGTLQIILPGYSAASLEAKFTDEGFLTLQSKDGKIDRSFKLPFVDPNRLRLTMIDGIFTITLAKPTLTTIPIHEK